MLRVQFTTSGLCCAGGALQLLIDIKTGYFDEFSHVLCLNLNDLLEV